MKKKNSIKNRPDNYRDPACPVCEIERKPVLSEIAAPARRALENAGITPLTQLSKMCEPDVLKLHGMGPGSIPKLRSALKLKGLSFTKLIK